MNNRNNSINTQNNLSSNGRASFITYLRTLFSNEDRERYSHRIRTNSNAINTISGNITDNSINPSEEPILSREVLQNVWNRMQNLPSEQRNLLMTSLRGSITGRSSSNLSTNSNNNINNLQNNYNSNDSNEEEEEEPEQEEERPPTSKNITKIYYLLNLVGRYRYYDQEAESNDEITNPQIDDEYIDYRTYPLLIDWCEIENEKSYAYTFYDKYGYFGVSLFSSLSKIAELNMNANKFHKNILEYYCKISAKPYKERSSKLNEFMVNLPELTLMKGIFANQIITKKEISTVKIVLDIYEHYFTNFESFSNKKFFKEYLPTTCLFYSMLSDEDVMNIYNVINSTSGLSEIMSNFF